MAEDERATFWRQLHREQHRRGKDLYGRFYNEVLSIFLSYDPSGCAREGRPSLYESWLVGLLPSLAKANEIGDIQAILREALDRLGNQPPLTTYEAVLDPMTHAIWQSRERNYADLMRGLQERAPISAQRREAVEHLWKEHGRLQRDFGSIYGEVLDTLFRIDPMRIAQYTGRRDEYWPEAVAIMPRLRTAVSSEDVRRIVEEAFRETLNRSGSSGHSLSSSSQDRYQHVAGEIWRVWNGRKP